MAKMSDTTLKAILQAEKADSLAGTQSSKLQQERKAALNYYMGDVSDDIPDIVGRSQAVSTDVADTVEGLMPQLMEVFAGSDDAVRFEPVSEEDHPAADQETEYIKHVFWNRNDGYLVLYSMIKDALLSKLVIAKVWWSTETKEQTETYFDQSDDQFLMLTSSPDVEVKEHTEKQDAFGQITHDITISVKTDHSKAKVEAIPPEEWGVSRRARTVKDAH